MVGQRVWCRVSRERCSCNICCRHLGVLVRYQGMVTAFFLVAVPLANVSIVIHRLDAACDAA